MKKIIEKILLKNLKTKLQKERTPKNKIKKEKKIKKKWEKNLMD